MAEAPRVAPPTVTESQVGGDRDTGGDGAARGDGTARGDGGPLSDLPRVDRARYAMDEELARGGRGRVWLARDRHMDRTVAIKEPIDGRPHTGARFVREALVTARLQHPAIVPVYETGRWDDGGPFYTMRLVEGRTLRDTIAAARTGADRLALVPHVLTVADAIAYAHGEGVIHRDLTPANILCGPFGETVVVDWGLAKVRGVAEPAGDEAGDGAAGGPFRAGGLFQVAAHALTRDGTVLGTPAYMPPEQARGQELDERADVYALGAILYHVLSGVPPYRGTSDEVMAALLAGPPRRLSVDEAPADLAAIVHRALAREPAARYPSARELADDVRRYTTGQLVRAHEYSAAARLARWLRRHKALVTLAAVALVVMTATAWIAVARTVRARDAAEDARRTAEDARRTAEDARRTADARADALTLLQARAALERDPATALAWLKTYPDGGADWAGARALAVDAESRSPARHVWRHNAAIGAVAVSPDGRLVATGGNDLSARVWALDDGGVRGVAHLRAKVTQLAFTSDGTALVIADFGGLVHLLDVTTGHMRTIDVDHGPLFTIAVSVDGQRIAAGGEDGRVAIVDREPGALRTLAQRQDTARITGLAFTPDGRALVAAGADGAVRAWDLDRPDDDAIRLGAHEGAVNDLVMSPGAARAISGGDDGILRLWSPLLRGRGDRAGASAASRSVVAPPAAIPLGAAVVDVDMSHDGRFVAAACMDKQVRIVDVRHGSVRALAGHADRVFAVAFVGDGTRVVSSANDGEVLVWDLATGRPRWLAEGGAGLTYLAPSPDGAWIAAGGGDGAARLLPAVGDGGRSIALPSAAPYLALSSRGTLAAGGRDGALLLVDAAGARRTIAGADAFSALLFSPGGHRLLVAGWDRRVRQVDVDGGTERTLVSGPGMTWALAADGDGNRGDLAAAGDDGVIRVWPDGAGEAPSTTDHIGAGQARLLIGHSGAVKSIQFLPGRRLVSGGTDGTLRLWDLAAGTSRVIAEERGEVYLVVRSPDGARLAVATLDGVTLWSTVDWTSVRLTVPGPAQARWLAFSPDGAVLAATTAAAPVIVWDTRSGDARVLAWPAVGSNKLAFLPGGPGARLVSTGGDGTVRMWDVADGTDRILHRFNGMALDVAAAPDGTIAATGADGTAWLGRGDGDIVGAGPAAVRQRIDALTSARIGTAGKAASPQAGAATDPR